MQPEGFVKTKKFVHMAESGRLKHNIFNTPKKQVQKIILFGAVNNSQVPVVFSAD
jgi:hypothetical protein